MQLWPHKLIFQWLLLNYGVDYLYYLALVDGICMCKFLGRKVRRLNYIKGKQKDIEWQIIQFCEGIVFHSVNLVKFQLCSCTIQCIKVSFHMILVPLKMTSGALRFPAPIFLCYCWKLCWCCDTRSNKKLL